VGVGWSKVGRSETRGKSVSLLDELSIETQFYATMHELSILAWQKGLTVEALLLMAELVDPLGDGGDEAQVPCSE
jgi:hypothetical protein